MSEQVIVHASSSSRLPLHTSFDWFVYSEGKLTNTERPSTDLQRSDSTASNDSLLPGTTELSRLVGISSEPRLPCLKGALPHFTDEETDSQWLRCTQALPVSVRTADFSPRQNSHWTGSAGNCLGSGICPDCQLLSRLRYY